MMRIHFQQPLPAYTFIMEFDHGWHLWVPQAHSFLARKTGPSVTGLQPSPFGS